MQLLEMRYGVLSSIQSITYTITLAIKLQNVMQNSHFCDPVPPEKSMLFAEESAHLTLMY